MLLSSVAVLLFESGRPGVASKDAGLGDEAAEIQSLLGQYHGIEIWKP